MNEPLGEYGGVVTRKLTLFGEKYEVGDNIESEVFERITVRHRNALQGAGLVRYFNEPEGKAGHTATKKVVKKKVVKKKVVNTNTTKRKTAKK